MATRDLLVLQNKHEWRRSPVRFFSTSRCSFYKAPLIVEMEKPDKVALTNVLTKRYSSLPFQVIGEVRKSMTFAVNDSGTEDSVMDIRQLVAWVGTSMTLKTFSPS